MSTITELKEAADLAEQAMRRIQSEKDNSIRNRVAEFKKEIEATAAVEFDERIVARTRTYIACVEARDAAIDAAARAGEGAPFPVGTKMFEWETPSRWAYSRERNLTLSGKVGVVEMITLDSQHPGNKSSYRMAALGEAVIRILKKDGTPGLQYERFVKNYGDTAPRAPYGWHVEGVDPNKKETT